MNDRYCQACGYEGSEGDFDSRDNLHELVYVLQESFEEGMISEESFNNLMDVFNTDICPNCGGKDSVAFFGYDFEITPEQLDAFHADREATEILYAYQVIDEDEYNARMDFADWYDEQ